MHLPCGGAEDERARLDRVCGGVYEVSLACIRALVQSGLCVRGFGKCMYWRVSVNMAGLSNKRNGRWSKKMQERFKPNTVTCPISGVPGPSSPKKCFVLEDAPISARVGTLRSLSLLKFSGRRYTRRCANTPHCHAHRSSPNAQWNLRGAHALTPASFS